MAGVLLQIGLLIWIYATLWFVFSLLARRNDVADIAWGLGYVVVCIYLFQTQVKASIPLLVYILVGIWALPFVLVLIHYIMGSKSIIIVLHLCCFS